MRDIRAARSNPSRRELLEARLLEQFAEKFQNGIDMMVVGGMVDLLCRRYVVSFMAHFERSDRMGRAPATEQPEAHTKCDNFAKASHVSLRWYRLAQEPATETPR